MMLIFTMSVLACIGGIAVQFDNDPSNNGAGWILAGVGGLVAILTAWAMWGALLPRDVAYAAKLAFFVALAAGGVVALLWRGHILPGIALGVFVLALGVV